MPRIPAAVKLARQPKVSVSTPPKAGATMGATTMAMVMYAKVLATRSW